MGRTILNARVTFRSLPIHKLERFAIRDAGDACRQFKGRAGLDECVVIQTCNRTEIFGAASGYDRGSITSTWAGLSGADEGAFDGTVQFEEGRAACEHLLRLVSGLDSMVLGEEQILGQVRGSVAAAREAGASGARLDALFDGAIRAGARIRGSSGVGRGGVSVGSMAVRLAEENVDGLKSRRILLIGTGEVASLVAKSLKRRGYGFDVSSRTVSRSEAFCGAMGGTPARFEDVLGGFADYDVVFVATRAPYFLVTYDGIAGAMGGRDGMMIMDLSNPRTVDERVATIGGVKLMNLDQIAEMVEKNARARRSSAGAAEGMIGGGAAALEAAVLRVDAEPLAGQVFRDAEAVRRRELERALRALGGVDEGTARVIEEMSRSISEGIVAGPVGGIRRASERGRGHILDAAREIFGPG
ncbi:MAG: glutamyl-tRNA reductase [Nitrosopumilus sp.]|nr:glutamyl-tRNA reductase [Nitrosopumilus sp.]MDA7941323.1 glutamyl-tRNA reductase [Nitrosopumilus sp.]MDA7942734.1 glutamyl-tRNA reductase [Nitrosopumilus sp.]MDA7945618.1 glutamyl-tRNA reductase [Nitrosopumilus sp.]MDA7952752.1 glutamyl-tRNA reductase [Nitrosopumilus sp.]